MIEQRFQPLFQQRQPMLHSCQSPPVADRLVERIGGGGGTEQLAVAGAEALDRLFVEQGLAIARELYLGMLVDRDTRRVVIMASVEGGMDIEKVAAETPEGLSSDNPARIAGRFLVPGRGQSFGHGTPVLGPDGAHWYYVHHRLQADRCRATGGCARDVWVSPIEFEDRGGGRGDVWIRARFPAEDPAVAVAL